MGIKIKIERDEDAENPRGNRYGTLFLAWHKRDSIGDPKPSRRFEHPESEFSTRDELLAALREELGSITELPVFMHDHGSQSFSTGGFSDRWDSGQLGWIFAVPTSTPDRWEGATPEQIADVLRAEIAEYHSWANGEIYAYRLVDDDGETLEAGSSYYSEDECREAANEALGERLAAEASDDAACHQVMAL
jgi:hypothetical protein